MLMVAFREITRVFPGSTIHVPTKAPELLGRLCPGVVPLSFAARSAWFNDTEVLGRTQVMLPYRVRKLAQAGLVNLRRSAPGVTRRILLARLRNSGQSAEEMEAFLDAWWNSDLLVVAGMGGVNEEKGNETLKILDMIDRKTSWGYPAACMSQGIGPLLPGGRNLKRAAEVYPSVSFFSLRERLTGPALLRGIGVPEDRITTSGDDAVQLASQEAGPRTGRKLGVNLRVISYSHFEPDDVPKLRSAVDELKKLLCADAMPVPILVGGRCSDVQTIAGLIGGGEADSPVEEGDVYGVLRRIRECRLVIAGSYHAGVFALSQGVPVVALARNDYYKGKFLGLQDWYPEGCIVVACERAGDWHERLKQAVLELWGRAEAVRPLLLSAAKSQSEAAGAAYNRLRESCGLCRLAEGPAVHSRNLSGVQKVLR